MPGQDQGGKHHPHYQEQVLKIDGDEVPKMDIVQVKIMSPITALFGFTNRDYCILGEEIKDGETMESVLRKLGKSHKEFAKIAFWPDPDTGQLSGINVMLNDHHIASPDGVKETKIHDGDVMTVFLTTE